MPDYVRDLDAHGQNGRVRTTPRFKKAAPGKGNSDPETLGGSRWRIKRIINHNARTLLDAQLELRLVEDALNQGELVHSELVLLNRRRAVLVRRMEGKDARYMALGARKGKLGKEDRARVDEYTRWLSIKDALSKLH
mgnify:FL=1